MMLLSTCALVGGVILYLMSEGVQQGGSDDFGRLLGGILGGGGKLLSGVIVLVAVITLAASFSWHYSCTKRDRQGQR